MGQPPYTILLVDDDPAITKLMASKLAKLDRFQPHTTNDPAAVTSLSKRLKPDLILCDIDMGENDGGSLARELAADPQTAGIPFLFLTSLVSTDQVTKNKGIIGGRAMISKKTPIGEIIRRIDAELAKG